MSETVFHREMQDPAEIRDKIGSIYQHEYPNGAPQLFQQMLAHMPPNMRRLVDREVRAKAEELTGREFDTLSQEDFRAIAQPLRDIVEPVYFENFTDDVLTYENAAEGIRNDIPRMNAAIPRISRNLIATAMGELPPERLQQMGCIFFDGDGTKTIVDCTSHAHACAYLQRLAYLFCVPPPVVQELLTRYSLTTEGYSVGGDEFMVIVRSKDTIVTGALLDEVATAFKAAVQEDPVLTASIDFKNHQFLMEYDNWSDDDREAYKIAPASMQQRLDAAERTLPDKFIPFVSTGTATSFDAIEVALSEDTEEAATLEALAFNVFQIMKDAADKNMTERKRAFRASGEVDPRQLEFWLRNAENRRLQQEITELRVRVQELIATPTDSVRQRIAEVKNEIDACLGDSVVRHTDREIPVLIAQLQGWVEKLAA